MVSALRRVALRRVDTDRPPLLPLDEDEDEGQALDQSPASLGVAWCLRSPMLEGQAAALSGCKAHAAVEA